MFLLIGGPRLLSGSASTAAKAADGTTPTSVSPAPTPTLAVATKQRLEDWRLHAGLYESNYQPAALPYVPDGGLGSWSQACRTSMRSLRAYRPGLMNAPDHQLSVAAAAYDAGAREVLRACISNEPVALHQARATMTVAAQRANARYDRLLGIDPTSITAPRAL